MPRKNSPKIKILLVNTNIPRNTKIMVQKVTDQFTENPYQVQEVIDEIDQIAKSGLALLTSECDIMGESNMFTKWGQLLERNQHLLAVGLGVSHSKLDAVCKIAMNYGLYAKLTGAGGGGYAFFILPEILPTKVLDCVKSELIKMDCSVCETTLGASGGVKINVL